MSNSVSFTCTALRGTNKTGKIKREADGYYRVILGGLNVTNSVGELYTYEGAKDLFNRSSSLMRRVERGALRSENGHPKWLPTMTEEQYANRIMQIYEDRVCAHIKRVDLVFDRYRDERGHSFIAIEGYVTPSGELGYVLEKALESASENIAFSIRSFTENIPTYNGVKKILRNIITWDFVGEPGIRQAEKYYSPTLEALEDKSFSRTTLERAFFGTQKPSEPMSPSLESVQMNTQELFKTLGWVRGDGSPSYYDWK